MNFSACPDSKILRQKVLLYTRYGRFRQGTKKQLAGFDELNVLANASDTSASGGETSSSAGGSSVFDSLPELEYQEMDIDTSKMEGKLKRIKNIFKSIWDSLETIVKVPIPLQFTI